MKQNPGKEKVFKDTRYKSSTVKSNKGTRTYSTELVAGGKQYLREDSTAEQRRVAAAKKKPGRSADASAGSTAAKQKAKLKAGGRSKVGYLEKGVYISDGGQTFEPFTRRKTVSDAIVKPRIKKK